ncbi:MAG: flagellin [Sulfurimonadaceae bacterium]
MDIGRVEMIDQSKVNHIEKMQKVQETDEKEKVVPNEQYKNAKPNEIIDDANEGILDNIKFGYNKSSQDFFVKVTRGDAEYKYPTEDMMKMKAQLLQLMEQQENK